MNKRVRLLLVVLAAIIGVILYFQSHIHFALPPIHDESSTKTGIDFKWESPPKLLKAAPFEVNVMTKDHVASDIVKVEFIMPSMNMPGNTVTPKLDGGVYKGAAMLTMSGHWIATVTLYTKSSGILDETIPFDVP